MAELGTESKLLHPSTMSHNTTLLCNGNHIPFALPAGNCNLHSLSHIHRGMLPDHTDYSRVQSRLVRVFQLPGEVPVVTCKSIISFINNNDFKIMTLKIILMPLLIKQLLKLIHCRSGVVFTDLMGVISDIPYHNEDQYLGVAPR